ncbi:hypothetical protein GUJ93_ZPchr0012g21363 [Zizania palustris]|uniref:Uncharacterized protein n=1 Tax=Zizania palustris TaxID=103762 RepID=A0A8J6BYR6_ZIZPA|nr:hypothetical protein GUJ93_ZPchr0012g21363 [Zizania palustris]
MPQSPVALADGINRTSDTAPSLAISPLAMKTAGTHRRRRTRKPSSPLLVTGRIQPVTIAIAGSPHQGDGNKCVSKNELGQLLQELNANILKSNQDNDHKLERIERSLATLVDTMENVERRTQLPNDRVGDIEVDDKNQGEYDPPLD